MPNPRGGPPGLIPDGPKIRQLRKERGLTIKKMAAQIGRHRESIGGVESVSRPFSDVFAYQIANALTEAGRKCVPPRPDIEVKDLLKDPDQLKERDEDEQVLAS